MFIRDRAATEAKPRLWGGHELRHTKKGREYGVSHPVPFYTTLGTVQYSHESDSTSEVTQSGEMIYDEFRVAVKLKRASYARERGVRLNIPGFGRRVWT